MTRSLLYVSGLVAASAVIVSCSGSKSTPVVGAAVAQKETAMPSNTELLNKINALGGAVGGTEAKEAFVDTIISYRPQLIVTNRKAVEQQQIHVGPNSPCQIAFGATVADKDVLHFVSVQSSVVGSAAQVKDVGGEVESEDVVATYLFSKVMPGEADEMGRGLVSSAALEVSLKCTGKSNPGLSFGEISTSLSSGIQFVSAK